MAISFKQNYSSGIIFSNNEESIKDFVFDLYVYNPGSDPIKSPEYINPDLRSLIANVRDYFLKIPDNIDYVTFDDGKKERKFNNKNGSTDHLVATLKVKNPNILGYNSPFNVEMRIEPTGSNKIFYQKSFPISRITQYTSLSVFNPNLQVLNPIVDFSQISETVRIYNLNINSSNVSNLISNGSLSAHLEILGDEQNLIVFDNGTKKKTITVSKTNVGITNEKLNIKNPSVFDYNKNINIKYTLTFALTASLVAGIVTTLQSGTLYEKELILNVKTSFQKPEVVTTNLDIIFDNLKNVNFINTTDEDKTYSFKCNIQNVDSLTENHVFQIKVENDTDQILTFSDNNSRIIELTDLKNLITNVSIKNPKRLEYDKNFNFVCTIQKVEANGIRTTVFSKTFVLNVTSKNANLNNQLNIFLNSFSKIEFNTVHEFRRKVNFNFLNQNIQTLDPAGQYLFELQVLDDVDDLMGVFNDDTKVIEYDLQNSINVEINITNPTELNYNKIINLKTTIYQINNQQKIILFSRLIPITIVTSYSTVKRSIFKGEREINISNVKLLPKPLGVEIENRVFLNESLFQPLIEINNNNEIIFDDFNSLDKTIEFNISITGLDIGLVTLKLQESNPYMLFENGLKETTYDINTNNNVSETNIPILVQNPYRINYEKEFELLVIVSDLIDEYAKKFNFKLKTIYSNINLQELITSTFKNIEKKLEKTIKDIDDILFPSLQTLQSLENSNFLQLNSNIQNINTEQIITNLNLPILFNSLNTSLSSGNIFLDNNIEYITPNIININDIEIFITNLDTNVVSKLDKNLYSLDDKSLHINKLDIVKGRYILQIKQQKPPIKILNIKSSTAYSNYTIVKVTDTLEKDYGQNYKINFNNNDYLIISNNKNELLLFENVDLNENDKINLIENLFEEQNYLVEINNYDIDDIGMIFLNKKVTNLETKNEKFYDENNNLIFELNYIVNNNLETRTK